MGILTFYCIVSVILLLLHNVSAQSFLIRENDTGNDISIVELGVKSLTKISAISFSLTIQRSAAQFKLVLSSEYLDEIYFDLQNTSYLTYQICFTKIRRYYIYGIQSESNSFVTNNSAHKIQLLSTSQKTLQRIIVILSVDQKTAPRRNLVCQPSLQIINLLQRS